MTYKGEKQKEYLQGYYEDKTRLQVIMSKNDLKYIEQIAKQRGQKVSTFCREAIFAQTKHQFLYPKEIKD